MSDFLVSLSSYFSDTQISPPGDEGHTWRFSNTGKRGGAKWFSITTGQLLSALQDMRSQRDQFKRYGEAYEETNWRRAFENLMTDKVVKAQGGVQTLPLFQFLAKVISAASSTKYRDRFINLNEVDLDTAIAVVSDLSLAEQDDTRTPSADDSDRLTGGQNILFYGAPGTGKSHAAADRAQVGRVFRTVFHPDMQNSDFVGTLKPGIGAEDSITYAFRPGPFSMALSYAWAHPREAVFLVVEELNRALAAAVFGELFQLLDRDSSGSGRYSVDFPSPEYQAWFEKASEIKNSGLMLPSNMWILATMNSADQGVFPLDTAFRRRWVQQYIPIDYGIAVDGDVEFPIDGASTVKLPWREFIRVLNEFLAERLDISEDRLLGPRFVEAADLENESIPEKLLIYLWDDLLRHHGREVLFAPEIKRYGEIHSRVGTGSVLFSKDFMERIANEVSTGDAVEEAP